MNVFELLEEQIDAKVRHLSDTLCSGRMGTYEDYKKLCGEIHGLLTAKDYITTLKDRLEKEDE